MRRCVVLAVLAAVAGSVAAPPADARRCPVKAKAAKKKRCAKRTQVKRVVLFAPGEWLRPVGWVTTPVAAGGVAPAPVAVPAGTPAPAPTPTPTPTPTATPAPPPPPVPTPPPSNPRRVSVRSTEFALTLSRQSVLAGDVAVEFNNTAAEDPHDLVLIHDDDPEDRHAFGEQPAGGLTTKTLHLKAGTYTLLCSLLDHAAQGMTATLGVE